MFSPAYTEDYNPVTLAEESRILMNHGPHFIKDESQFGSQTAWADAILPEEVILPLQVLISSFSKF